MNSKEALERLVDKTGIMNDTCARLDKCLKCGKCQIDDEPVETCDDYNLVMTIKKDLDRLEKLEKENQELKELNEEYFDGNALRTIKINKLQEENAKLKKVIGILEKRLGVKIKVCINGGCSISILVNDRLITPNNEYLKYIDEEEYELLREVLENATN